MEHTSATKDGGEPRVIKRYANRKLYDTRDSRYVTLQQIAEYVRAGEDVQIIDNTTKESLTHVTLAQIVYEEEKKGEAPTRAASIGTLRQMIQTGSEKLLGTLREGPMGKLIAKRANDDGARGDDSEPAKKSASMAEKSREALEELQRVADDRLRVLVSSAIAPVHHLQGEVKRLQARIEELEARLVKASQPRARKDDPKA